MKTQQLTLELDDNLYYLMDGEDCLATEDEAFISEIGSYRLLRNECEKAFDIHEIETGDLKSVIVEIEILEDGTPNVKNSIIHLIC